MAVDIKDFRLSEGRITVDQISPTNLDTVVAPLNDIVLENSALTYDYYADTRTSGKLVFMGASQYRRGSFIRIKYSVTALGYSVVLGTYMVTGIQNNYKNRADQVALTLQSAGLYPLSLHKTQSAVTLANGSKAIDAIVNLLNKDKRKYTKSTNRDYTFSGNGFALSSNETYLKEIFTLAALCNVRIDVEPNGYVLLHDRIMPLDKSVRYTLDMNDPMGIVYNDVSRSSDELTVPSEFVVSYTGSDNTKSDEWKEEQRKKNKNYKDSITITAVSTTTGNNSANTRGYTVTDYISESDLTPSTYDRAKALADKYMKIYSTPDTEWKIKTSYFPLALGDAIEFIPRASDIDPYTSSHKTFVKQIDISDLQSMDFSLTLKEATTYDPEEES